MSNTTDGKFTCIYSHLDVFCVFIPDEQFLANFLYHRKNSLEVTKEKLELFYTARAAIPDIFSNYDPCSSNFAKSVATQ